MSNRQSEIDSRLRALEQAVTDLSQRLNAFERGQPTGDRPAEVALVAPSDLHATRAYLSYALPFVGRSLIVLAGAFLLRSLAESGHMPGRTGAILGLGYATLWLTAAERGLGSPSELSRLFHGLTALVIAVPLLWEATTRFGFFPPAVSAATLGLFTIAAFAVASHRRLQILAGIATSGAVLAMPALAIATRATGVFAVLAIAVVIATWILGETRGWRWLAWPAGLAELLLAWILMARALAAPSLEPVNLTLGVLLFLLTVATAPFVIRAIRKGAGARVFDAVHAIVAVPMCLVGLSVGASQATPTGVGAIGAVMAAAGAGLYWIEFSRVLPRQGAGRNFYTGTSVALAYVVVGASEVLPAPAAALVCSAAALAALRWSGRPGCAVLALHATLLLGAAAIAAGLIDAVLSVWVGWPRVWPAISFSSVGVLAVLVVGMGYGMTRDSAKSGWLSTVAYVALNALTLVAIGGAVLIWVGPFIAGTPPAPPILATLKTAVLALSGVLLSIAARQSRREVGWLAYPVLAVGAVQLLIEHAATSRAATWFVALAIYGIALVIASRSLSRRA
jgi:hypothetical protein